MDFHSNLSDCKSPQVSRTLLSILADLKNAIVWMVSTRSLISKSYSLWINPLVTVPSVPITIDITVTFTFHSFFSSLARSWYLSLFWLSFSFPRWSAGTAKSIFRQVLSFFLFFIYIYLFFFFFCLLLGLVVWPRFADSFISQKPREVCASHFLCLILAFLQFSPVVSRDGKIYYSAGSLIFLFFIYFYLFFFFLSITRPGCLTEICWSVYISKT